MDRYFIIVIDEIDKKNDIGEVKIYTLSLLNSIYSTPVDC